MLNVNIKDSDWPEWAKFAAQDKNGDVYFYREKPEERAAIWDFGGTHVFFKSGDHNLNWKQAIIERPESTETRKHSHYFKDVSTLNKIDVYRVLDLYEVTDPCVQHAVKKLLVAGNRGAKDKSKDIQEAIDTLTRWQEMQDESI